MLHRFKKIIPFVVLVPLLFYLCLVPHFFYLRHHNPHQTAFIQAKGKKELDGWVRLYEISPHLCQAVLIAEDGDFYHHHGVDLVELKAAFQTDLRKQRWARGGSTITMQLAKNIYLTSAKSLVRKLAEMMIALGLEQTLSKERILELYLNVIEWGPKIFGVDAAAQHYFHKTASGLTPAESAYLAAIIPNPVLYTLPRYRDYVDRRKKWILYRMGHPEIPPEQQPEPVPPPEIIKEEGEPQPLAPDENQTELMTTVP